MKFWPWFRNTEPVIKPLCEHHYRFTGFDAALRDRTAKRRREADAMKADASKLETQDDRRSRIQLVR